MSRLLASTLGLLSPRYRTLSQWSEVYRQIIAARPVCDKTKANRRSALRHIIAGLGGRTISSIRPHEVAAFVQVLHAKYPQAAKRVLVEARDVFNEAINYGWIDRNPAAPIRLPAVRVRRKRLTLEQWHKIHAQAVASFPPWVSRMLVLALVTGQRRSDLCRMRFSDVWGGHLHIEQAKTGARVALPLSLRLDALGVSLGEAIDACRDYAVGADYLLRKHNGRQLGLSSLSTRFESAREMVFGVPDGPGAPSLHECRSLSERLYREQGIDTRILLGHRHQAMTDIYNDDRGLSAAGWQELKLPSADA